MVGRVPTVMNGIRTKIEGEKGALRFFLTLPLLAFFAQKCYKCLISPFRADPSYERQRIPQSFVFRLFGDRY